MNKRAPALVALSLLLVTVGFAKGKTKRTLPPYVLEARTIAVIIAPGMQADRSKTRERIKWRKKMSRRHS